MNRSSSPSLLVSAALGLALIAAAIGLAQHDAAEAFGRSSTWPPAFRAVLP